MRNKEVAERFSNISEQVSIVLEKYETMDIRELLIEQRRVVKKMTAMLNKVNVVDTDITLELYHIGSNIFDRVQNGDSKDAA